VQGIVLWPTLIHRPEYNIKMGLKNIACEGAGCIDLAQDTANWMGFVNIVMNDRSGTSTVKLEAVYSSEVLATVDQLHAAVS
jgi:hypothetical protein